ncbi:MarR family winged helix-turn-helix transcriptional regulator [Bacteroidota bacterium]
MKKYNLADLINIILTTSERIEEEMKEKSEVKDLTYKQLYCIELIKKMENPNLTELAEALKITKPSTSVMIDKLENNGYVQKVRLDADRRNSHIHLTDLGNAADTWHYNVHRKIASLLSLNLDKMETEQLINLLNQAVISLK